MGSSGGKPGCCQCDTDVFGTGMQLPKDLVPLGVYDSSMALDEGVAAANVGGSARVRRASPSGSAPTDLVEGLDSSRSSGNDPVEGLEYSPLQYASPRGPSAHPLERQPRYANLRLYQRSAYHPKRMHNTPRQHEAQSKASSGSPQQRPSGATAAMMTLANVGAPSKRHFVQEFVLEARSGVSIDFVPALRRGDSQSTSGSGGSTLHSGWAYTLELFAGQALLRFAPCKALSDGSWMSPSRNWTGSDGDHPEDRAVVLSIGGIRHVSLALDEVEPSPSSERSSAPHPSDDAAGSAALVWGQHMMPEAWAHLSQKQRQRAIVLEARTGDRWLLLERNQGLAQRFVQAIAFLQGNPHHENEDPAPKLGPSNEDSMTKPSPEKKKYDIV